MADDHSMQAQWNSSYFSGPNAEYLEALYEDYLLDPSNVPSEWVKVFESLNTTEDGNVAETIHSNVRAAFRYSALHPKATAESGSPQQAMVANLITAYRNFGHREANLDPLGLAKPTPMARLTTAYYGLQDAGTQEFDTCDLKGVPDNDTLDNIIAALKNIYCDSIGFEYSQVTCEEEIAWLQDRIEVPTKAKELTKEQKHRIFHKLVQADGLERYLGRKYVGQKRFSLEGGDSLIPCLDIIVEKAGEKQVREVVIGMAHRGRLNVLVNILGKPPRDLFNEFDGKHDDIDIAGDVKYHNGYSTNVVTQKGMVHLALAFNPSHLEIVSPVAIGSVRARQRRRLNTEERDQVVPIIMHGDSAFSGQGVVMETFALSQTRGFSVGGSIHIVVNNQVGFTTSNPHDTRSSNYCTDVAKMVQAPIFHVNADDPEAVVRVAAIAFDYRMRFKKDVVIDLVCYRRHGHNEADEPRATQPIMYKAVRPHPVPRELYAKKLIAEGLLTTAEAKAEVDGYTTQLDQGDSVVQQSALKDYEYAINWEPYLGHTWDEPAKTTVELKELQACGNALLQFPEGFELQAQVKKVMEDRRHMIAGDKPLDWGCAENLAYATLLKAGYPIRLSGQDSGRGTFAHRHAVLHNQADGSFYTPLNHLDDSQASAVIIDSVLSEEAVMAFEYGYATADPSFLVLWEAQFGDFANGAQVVIDQFISSGEQKWGRFCGLILLLPHGMESMGAEHSSARLERYLQLCAQNNMQVCVPSTPAQTFHMIRRQMLRPYRKPLIVMTPKSLLRHKLAVSSLEDLTHGEFKLVIPEIEQLQQVKRLVLCSGKVYYDLLAQRRESKVNDIALVRVEQLYPFPLQLIQKQLKQYSDVSDIVWCQEEPKNQGAWRSIQHRLIQTLQPGQTLTYIGRDSAAAPAVGLRSIDIEQQHKLVNEALAIKG